MNKKLSAILCTLLIGGMCAGAVGASAPSTDLDGHWAEDSMQFFVDSGWMDDYGVVSVNYSPDAALDRAGFVGLLDRFARTPVEVNDTDEDGVFSREEAMVIVASALGLENGDTTALDRFADAAEVSESARGAVAALVAGGYIHGTEGGLLSPKTQLTRAEGVTILDNIYDTLTFDLSEHDTVYGTATLTYGEFYSGDVSSTDSFGVDGVSSATVSKYDIFNGRVYHNFTEDKTEGYNILGVHEVNVAVSAEDYYDYIAIEPTFKLARTAPKQYKPVAVVDGQAIYSATVVNLVETVTDATAELLTNSTWGDYQINVTETSTKNIRNTREDTGFAIGGDIQGIILETESGLRVGTEHLQNIWVQPWEVSFNVTADSPYNSRIAAHDNLTEFAKLVGEKVTSITYIMPDSTYVYTFDGIYIKPAYEGDEVITATFTEGSADIALANVPTALEDVTVDVYYGSGRKKTVVATDAPVVDGKVTMTEAYSSENTYTVTVSSSNYAGIIAESPATSAERSLLEVLALQAKLFIDSGAAAEDSGLIEHYEEAVALLADENATSSAVVETANELNSHLSVYNG